MNRIIFFLLVAVLLLSVQPVVQPTVQPIVQLIDAQITPQIFRGKDFEEIDNGDGTKTNKLNLPEFVLNPSSGLYVNAILSDNGTHVIMDGSTPLAINKADCQLSVYEKGFINQNSIVNSHFDFQIHESDLASETFAKLPAKYAKSCQTSTLQNSTGTYITFTKSFNDGINDIKLQNTIAKHQNEYLPESFHEISYSGADTTKQYAFFIEQKTFNTQKILFDFAEYKLIGNTIEQKFQNGTVKNTDDLVTIESKNLAFPVFSIISELPNTNNFVYDIQKAESQIKSIELRADQSELSIETRYYETAGRELKSGEKIFLDPTFGFSASSFLHMSISPNTSAVCVSDSTASGSTIASGIGAYTWWASSSSNGCASSIFEVDVSSIADTAFVTGGRIKGTTSSTSFGESVDFTFIEDDTQPTTRANTASNARLLFNETRDGASTLTTTAFRTHPATDVVLGIGASSFITSSIQSGKNWVALGFLPDDRARDSQTHQIVMSALSMELTYIESSATQTTFTATGKQANVGTGTGASCPVTGNSITAGSGYTWFEDPNSAGCTAGVHEVDVSIIPDSATIFNVAVLINTSSNTLGRSTDLTWIDSATQPTTRANDASNALALFNEIKDGTILNGTSTNNNRTKSVVDLGVVGDANFQSDIASGQNWIAFGLLPTDRSRDGSAHQIVASSVQFQITYSASGEASSVSPRFLERDGTVVTSGTILAKNSTGSFTDSVNSTGYVTFYGQTGNSQNYTLKEGADSFVVNKTYNYVPASGVTTWDSNSFIFDVDCSDSGTGTDFEFLLNDTDGHQITSFTTPSCSASNVVTSTAIFTANGQNSGTFTSSLIVRSLNTTHFGEAFALTIDGSSVGSSLSGTKLTSSSYTVGDGFTSNTVPVSLTFKFIPRAPTALDVTAPSATQVNLDWDAPSDTGHGTISGYKIERESPVGGGFSVLVANTGSTSSNYQDMNTVGNTQYNYRVSAINEVGAGFPSIANSVTTPAGGGGLPEGGGGSGGGGGGGSPDPENLFDLSIFGDTKIATLGQVFTNQHIRVTWSSTSNIMVSSITPTQSPFLIVFETPPLEFAGDPSGRSMGDIMYGIQVPNKECADVQLNDCVFLVKYEIPVEIVFEHEGVSYPRTAKITMDLSGDIGIVSYVIIGGVAVPLVGLALSKMRKKEVRTISRGTNHKKNGNHHKKKK